MRSLASKLTLAFLLVSAIGTLLLVLVLRWQTAQEFDRYVRDRYAEDVANVTTQLQAYYEARGSWEGIGAVVIREGMGRGEGGGRGAGAQRNNAIRLIALADAEGRVLTSGGASFPVGQQLSTRELRQAEPIIVGGETVGYLILTSLRPNLAAESAESRFLDRVLAISLLGLAAATVLSLLLGSLLAYTIARPVRELTSATRAIASGELGRQVAVRTSDELGELGEAFNQMSRDLAEATRLRRQMTADIAHDLRTPLTTLLGYTEALSEGKFEGSPQIYRALHQESQHLQRLVDDLRTLSLADAGELALHAQPVEPGALLERVRVAHGAQADGQGTTLRVEVPATLPMIRADEERLVQVLNNLLHNALRHTGDGDEIVLRGVAEGGALRLQVADSGSGIAPEHLPHIWDRLYRGDRARERGGSSGLGLSIARSLVEAHGGTIAVESVPGVGTTFTISLPVGTARMDGEG